MPTSVLLGYDGSPEANAAITASAALFPGAHAWITYVWSPPFASQRLRRRLRTVARDVNDLVESIQREGEREADAIVASGVALARAEGWDAEPLLKLTFGSDGLRLAQMAERLRTAVLVVGARGLGGVQAVLGSVSDIAVHYATVPVLVVPNPLLEKEFAALKGGPVVVGYDGSKGAEMALGSARRLFHGRDVVLAAVRREGDEDVVAGPLANGMTVQRVNVPDRPDFANRATADALVACADRHNAAVLVVGSRGRSVTREVTLGSVARETVHQSHRPVLVVHS